MNKSTINTVFKNLSLVGQLGISIVAPILLCILICCFLIRKFSVGVWIYIPGILFGLGGSFMSAYKVYISETKKAKTNLKNKIGFNEHV